MDYNCIAWAAGDIEAWWWPDAGNIYYWPPSVVRQETLECFQRAFESLGYQVCETIEHELGYEKIAVYSGRDGRPTHAARQLSTGQWTSKLGREEDIQHDTPECLKGDIYGEVALVMRRPEKS